MQFILMITVFRTIYTEEILNYTPLQTGFIISVSSLPMLFCSYIAGFLADKVSPRLPITTGYILIIFSFFWLGFFPIPTLAEYIFPLCLFGIGAPFIFTPSYSLVMSNLPSEKVGVAMGMVSTLRMLAASMGLALIYLFIDTRQASLLPTVGYREAVIDSFSSVHFFLGALMIIAFLLNIFLYKGKSAHRLPDAPSDGWD
jgi:MFS family permease